MPWIITQTRYQGGKWVPKRVDRKPFLKASWDTRAEARDAARRANGGR